MISRRGVFGLLAGLAAVPFVKAPEAHAPEATATPVENLLGSDRASVVWFNRARGIGKVEGIDSGREIWLRKAAARGVGNLRPGEEVLVTWRLTPRGYEAYAVRRSA